MAVKNNIARDTSKIKITKVDSYKDASLTARRKHSDRLENRGYEGDTQKVESVSINKPVQDKLPIRKSKSVKGITINKVSLKSRKPTKMSPKKSLLKDKKPVKKLSVRKKPEVAAQNIESDIERKRILIIDDEESIVETLKEIIDMGGYHAEVALNGEEAKKQILSGYFHLALLDLKLPDISGLDLLKWMKREAPRTLVIVVTGYPSLDNAVESLNHGANAYIMKPINPKELLGFLEVKLQDQDQKEVGILDEILPNYLDAIKDGNLWSVDTISYKLKVSKVMVEKMSMFCSNLGMIKYWRNRGVIQKLNVKL